MRSVLSLPDIASIQDPENHRFCVSVFGKWYAITHMEIGPDKIVLMNSAHEYVSSRKMKSASYHPDRIENLPNPRSVTALDRAVTLDDVNRATPADAAMAVRIYDVDYPILEVMSIDNLLVLVTESEFILLVASAVTV